jgi:hypothetical protein
MSHDDKSGAKASKFGSCCQDLKEVLEAEDFDPLVYEAEDGVLYLSVGILDVDDGSNGDATETDDDDDEEGSGFLDHPVYFCPFCGTKIQTPEEVEAKAHDA